MARSGRRPPGRDCEKVLGEALVGPGDDSVAGFQDGLGRPVVLFEAHHLGWRNKAVGKIEDVAHRRRAEGIDRLGVVADDGDAGAVGLQTEQDRRLQGVGVLVLIDEDVIEAVGDKTCDLLDPHHLRPVEQQIVVVEHRLGLLGFDVAGEQALQRLRPFGAPGEGAIERLADRQLGIDGVGVDGKTRRLLRKPTARLAEAEIVANQVDQVGGIAAVEN